MSPAHGDSLLRAPAGLAAARPAGRQAGYEPGPLWMRIVPPAVTLAVMLWGIEGSSYWRDEAATLAAVRRPFGDLVAMLGNVDAVHGAYYMLVWVVVRAGGTSEAVTRLPSALAMAAAAAGVAAIGRRLVSPRAGLTAGLVFAALPKVSWFGQDARSYAMVAALATAASYLLVRLLDAGSTRRSWLAAYAACLAGLGVANVFALLIIPAHGLTMLLAPRTWAGPARASGAIPAPPGPVPGGHGRDPGPVRAPAAGAAPLHGGAPPDRSSPPGGRAMRPGRAMPADSVLAGWTVAAGLAVAVTCPLIVLAYRQRHQIGWIQDAQTGGPASVRQLVGPLALFELMVLIMACAIMFSALRGRGGMSADWPLRLPALCLPWLLVPPAALLCWSLIQPVYTFRYILFCIPAAALLGGAAVAATGRVAGTIALVLVVLVGLPAQVAERGPDGHGDNIRGLDRVIAAHARAGDGVYYPQTGARSFDAAYPYGLPLLRDIALKQAPAKPAKLTGANLRGSRLREALTDVRRLWVVEVRKLAPVPMLRGLRFRPEQRWHVSDLWLLLYVHRTAVRDPDGHSRV
jgi:mannosyltransferase